MSGCPEWLRQHRMRLDWQTIIKSCYDNMAWEKVKRGWEKAYITNASASEIIFQDIRPAEGYIKIFIQSKTSDNRAKAIVGETTPIKHCGHRFWSRQWNQWSSVSYHWARYLSDVNRTCLKGNVRRRSFRPSRWLLGKAPSGRKTFRGKRKIPTKIHAVKQERNN